MSVLTMVSDPEFIKLAPADQQSALAGVDPDFGRLAPSDFDQAVIGLQRRALVRPDLVAPPPAASAAPMQTSTLGQVYDQMQNPAAVPNPKLASAQSVTIDPNSPASQVGAGALGGALETVHTGLRAANKVTGDRLNGLPTTYEEPESLKAKTRLEQMGHDAEGLIEFLSGDELLKYGGEAAVALSHADRLAQAAGIMKIYEKYPIAANLMDKGLQTLRAGTTAGMQEVAHGNPEQALGTAGRTAAMVGTLGALTELGTAVYNPIKQGLLNGLTDLIGKAQSEAAINAIPEGVTEKELASEVGGSPWKFNAETAKPAAVSKEELESTRQLVDDPRLSKSPSVAGNITSTQRLATEQAAGKYINPPAGGWDAQRAADITTSWKPLLKKVGLKATLNLGAYYAAGYVMDLMGMDAKQKQVVNTVGLSALGLSGMRDIINSPAGKLFGAKVAAAVVNHPETMNAVRNGINATLAGIASKATHVHDAATGETLPITPLTKTQAAGSPSDVPSSDQQ